MTEAIRNELESVPFCYPRESLRRTYHYMLSSQEQTNLPRELVSCLGPLIRAGQAMSKDQKARLLYEVLSRYLTYDDTDYASGEGLRRYTYAGGLTTGRAVCMGIAELYTLLGTAFGLRVQTVIGYGGDPVHHGGLHAWNIVWLPDAAQKDVPYHIDLTWDLSSSVRLRGYEYYLKSDEYMKTHDHTWLQERYPRCPHNRSRSQIPHIPRKAVNLVLQRLQMMHRGNKNK